MKHDFRLADIGEGLEEAEIITWLVNVGDHVSRDQPLIEVMTDKSNAELPSPASGTVVELAGAVGDIIHVGELIAVIDDLHPADDESAAGGGTDATRPFTEAPPPSPSPSADVAAAPGTAAAPTTAPQVEGAPAPRPKASPATRKTAAARGIDLTTLTGSGPGGRILLADLDQTAQRPVLPAPPPAPRRQPPGSSALGDDRPVIPPHVAHAPNEHPAAAGDDLTAVAPEVAEAPNDLAAVAPEVAEAPNDLAAVAPEVAEAPNEQSSIPASTPRSGAVPSGTVPLRGIRRAVAQNMARSWFDIPHIHAFEHIDAEPMLNFRERLKNSGQPAYRALTPLSFFVSAVASALRAHPEANASINMAEETITYHPSVNVGVAVAAPQGLVVPVLRAADGLDFPTLCVTLGELVGGARAGSLGPEHFKGGTATITNFGSLGGEQAAPLIRPPESIIVGFGSIADRPFVIDGDVVARKTLNVVLGADHRLLDGDITTAVVNHVVSILTDPLRLVL